MSGGGRREGARDLVELRLYFGERDRDGDGPLESAVIEACARHGVEAAVTLRGVEGFGAKQRLRTDRLLSLSEDAPLVVVAAGETETIEGLAEEVRGMAGDGLLVTAPTGTAAASAAMAAVPVGADEELVKATVWGPRGGAESPHLDAVVAMKRRGAEAATVLLGVDGVLEGERRRARFVAGNRGVPAITVAIGTRAAIEAALDDLRTSPPLVTVAPVETYSRIAGSSLHNGDAATRVTLVTSEIAADGAHPRYLALIHKLREEGAAGATALRGVWGFRGDREPHGDRVLALRRDVPMIVEAVDTPEGAERWRALAESVAGLDDLVHVEEHQRTFTLARAQPGT